jgi:hypothetical protein
MLQLVSVLEKNTRGSGSFSGIMCMVNASVCLARRKRGNGLHDG